jgi:SsrA-binding protein
MKNCGKKNNITTISKRKYIDFKIIWSIESGIQLEGMEVKKIRINKPSIDTCYGTIIENSIFLKNFFNRNIRLLLNKHEIKKIKGLYSKVRRILIVDHLYDNSSYIKVNLVVAEKLQHEDKRKILIKKDETKRSKFKLNE